jgi:hypothetical protein
MAVRVAQGMGEQDRSCQPVERFPLARARHMVANRLGDALPGRFILCCGAHSQERTEVLKPACGLARLIHVETMNDERTAVL